MAFRSMFLFALVLELYIAAVLGCDSTDTIYLSSGENELIQSPNYPNDYADNTIYCWYIWTSESSLVIKVNDYETEYTWDYINIYDNSYADGYELASLSGSGSGQTYYTSGAYAYIVFTTDSSNTATGFQICVYPVGGDDCSYSTSTPIDLSIGEIVGIAMGCVSLVIIVTCVAVCCTKGQCGKNKTNPAPTTGVVTVMVVARPSPSVNPDPGMGMGLKPRLAPPAPVAPPPPPAAQPPNPFDQVYEPSYPPANPNVQPQAQYPPPAYSIATQDPAYPPMS